MTTTNNTTAQIRSVALARIIGVGNVNAANATGRGNRARRRAGWRVIATAGPEWHREQLVLLASV